MYKKKKTKINITLSVDKELYKAYREYTIDKGIIVSKQYENFMLKTLKR